MWLAQMEADSAMTALNESAVELAALELLRQLGRATENEVSIVPDMPGAERSPYKQIDLFGRLRSSAARISSAPDASVVERR